MLARLWPDRLAARIALVMLLALSVECLGGEWLFQRAEAARAAETRLVRLAEDLTAAERLVSDLPVAMRDPILQRVWPGDPNLSWTATQDTRLAAPSGAVAAELQGSIASLTPGQPARILRLSADAPPDRLIGALQLADGSWLRFETLQAVSPPFALERLGGPVLTLLLGVGVAALGLTWTIARPLRRLASAADQVGQSDEPVVVPDEGPLEVRQAARAFNAMRARLVQQVDERMQALAAVSHDLRTPIARLRLRTAEVRPAGVRRGVQHDLDEMDRFIGSVLDYLRGGDAEPLQAVDLAAMVHTIVDDAQDAGADVTFEGPRRLEAVTRPVKLQRAVLNLVQNATQHADRVTVVLRQEGETAIIVVSDDGPGIPDEQLEAVFQPFYRLEGSRNRGTGGAGLGLSIVRRSAIRLGGCATLSNRPDGGLHAELRIPVRVEA